MNSESYTEVTMTPQEKDRLKAKAKELKRRTAEIRRKGRESDKRIDEALVTLRELSGRA